MMLGELFEISVAGFAFLMAGATCIGAGIVGTISCCYCNKVFKGARKIQDEDRSKYKWPNKTDEELYKEVPDPRFGNELDDQCEHLSDISDTTEVDTGSIWLFGSEQFGNYNRTKKKTVSKSVKYQDPADETKQDHITRKIEYIEDESFCCGMLYRRDRKTRRDVNDSWAGDSQEVPFLETTPPTKALR